MAKTLDVGETIALKYQDLLDTLRASEIATYDETATDLLTNAIQVVADAISVEVQAGLNANTNSFAALLPKLKASIVPLKLIKGQMEAIADKIADGAKVLSLLAEAIKAVPV